MKQIEKRKLEQIETENSTRPSKQLKIEDTVTIRISDEEMVGNGDSMSSMSPESDSEKTINYDSPPGTPVEYIATESNSSNFGSVGDISARPKHFTTNMFRDDIERFNKAREESVEAESKFIQDYINKHKQYNVESADDVYSLLLGCAIDLRDIKLVEHILSIKHESNILTYVDGTHFSPVSSVLGCKDYEILKLVGQYVTSITKNSDDTIKTDFSEAEDNSSISSRTSNPSFEYIEPIDFYNHLLVPLYTEKSLEELAELIGADVTETFNEPDTWW